MTHLRQNRTRFLEALTDMVRQDRDGALDDMLQVLVEHGRIQELTASMAVDGLALELDGKHPQFHDYVAGTLSRQLGVELGEKAEIHKRAGAAKWPGAPQDVMFSMSVRVVKN